jgi:hypothetical protein
MILGNVKGTLIFVEKEKNLEFWQIKVKTKSNGIKI